MPPTPQPSVQSPLPHLPDLRLFLHAHKDAPDQARAVLLRKYCELALVPMEVVLHAFASTSSLGDLPTVVFGGRCYGWDAAFRKLRTQWAPMALDQSELEPDVVGFFWEDFLRFWGGFLVLYGKLNHRVRGNGIWFRCLVKKSHVVNSCSPPLDRWT